MATSFPLPDLASITINQSAQRASIIDSIYIVAVYVTSGLYSTSRLLVQGDIQGRQLYQRVRCTIGLPVGDPYHTTRVIRLPVLSDVTANS